MRIPPTTPTTMPTIPPVPRPLPPPPPLPLPLPLLSSGFPVGAPVIVIVRIAPPSVVRVSIFVGSVFVDVSSSLV